MKCQSDRAACLVVILITASHAFPATSLPVLPDPAGTGPILAEATAAFAFGSARAPRRATRGRPIPTRRLWRSAARNMVSRCPTTS